MNGESEGDALSEQLEDDWHPTRSRRYARVGRTRSGVTERARGTHYYPETDALAKDLIEMLGTYVWETIKVRGTFVSNPYSIKTEINGQLHTIHLPGRFGTTLSWLKQKRDAHERP